MKRLGFITVLVMIGFSLLFFSCGEGYIYTILVANNSSKVVSYFFDNHSDSLSVGESKTYTIETGSSGTPRNISVPGAMSIKMISGTNQYSFTDVAPLNLNVINTLPVAVVIKADNYIDDNGSTELSVSANTEFATAKIYTSTPKFTSTSNYPIEFDWNHSGDTIYVIIR